MGDCAVAFKIPPTKSKTRIDRFDRCSPNLTYDRSVHHVYVTRARSVCINNLLVSRGANLYRRVPFFIVARSVDFIFELNEKERDRRTFTVISHEFIPNELFERSLTVALCLSLSRTLGRGEPIANVLDGRRSDCATRHSAALRVVALARTRCTRGFPHHSVRQAAPPNTRPTFTVTSNPHFLLELYIACYVIDTFTSPVLAEWHDPPRHSLLFRCTRALPACAARTRPLP